MKTLVLGGGGFVGLNLIDSLAGLGVDVVAGSRREAPRVALRQRGCPRVLADLDRPDTLVESMRGMSVVYHAAGHYPRHSLDPRGTLDLGVRQTRNLLDAAALAGVRRLVYVSTVATVAPREMWPSTEMDLYPGPPGFGAYHDVKWTMEKLILDEARFETVVACPGACLGPWDMRIGTSGLLVSLARGLPIGVPEGLVNLVDVRDVAQGLVVLGQMNEPPKRTIFAASNDQMGVLVQWLAKRYGVRPPRMLTASDAVALSNAEEERCLTDGRRPMLSREIVDLVVHGVAVDNGLSRHRLGLRYRPVEQTLDAFDSWARKRRILPPPFVELSP